MSSPSSQSTSEQSAVDRVVSELERVVVDDVSPGDKLPSENEMAAAFNVSRLTVREALKTLAARDLVELRAGRSAVVTAPNSQTLSRMLQIMVRRTPQSVLELIEVRTALEVQAAELASHNARRNDVLLLNLAVEQMRQAAERLADGVADEAAYNEADITFHDALASASGNAMLHLLVDGLRGALREGFEHSFHGHVLRGASVADVVEQHRSVVLAIEKRDEKAARVAMARLLQEAVRDTKAWMAGVKEAGVGEGGARG